MPLRTPERRSSFAQREQLSGARGGSSVRAFRSELGAKHLELSADRRSDKRGKRVRRGLLGSGRNGAFHAASGGVVEPSEVTFRARMRSRTSAMDPRLTRAPYAMAKRVSRDTPSRRAVVRCASPRSSSCRTTWRVCSSVSVLVTVRLWTVAHQKTAYETPLTAGFDVH